MPEEGKRTTCVLNSDDLENLCMVVEFLKLPSDTEAIRRSLRIVRILLEFQTEGGRVIFRDSKGDEEVVRFL